MSKQKLWIDDLNSFFGDWSLIPTSKMTIEEKIKHNYKTYFNR